MKRIMLITLALSLWICGQALCEPIVVANNDVGENTLNQDEVKNIFLGKKVKWDSGKNITPVILSQGPVHDDFLKRFVKKNDRQYSKYWKQMIFTGQGTPPKAFASEADLVNFIKQTPGSVGYIDSATPYDGVKVVSVK